MSAFPPAAGVETSMSSVRDAAVTRPKICGPETTVAQARQMFGDDHVHSLLLVRRGRLVSVVERDDLRDVPEHLRAEQCGSLHGRLIAPDVDLETAFRAMVSRSVRRLAVVDEQHHLLGLLCMKRSWRGFCSDADVDARALSARDEHRPGC